MLAIMDAFNIWKFFVSVNDLIVSNFNVTYKDRAVAVSWTPPHMSAYVSWYEVQWRVKGSNASYKAKDVGLATSATLDSGLNRRQAYDVRVVSVDSNSQIEEQSVESSAKSVSLGKLVG